ncbi:hypothetical protein AB0F42_33990 [Streptomyces buecherae]
MTNGVLDGSKHVPAHPHDTSRTGAGRTGRPPAPTASNGTDSIDGIGR